MATLRRGASATRCEVRARAAALDRRHTIVTRGTVQNGTWSIARFASIYASSHDRHTLVTRSSHLVDRALRVELARALGAADDERAHARVLELVLERVERILSRADHDRVDVERQRLARVLRLLRLACARAEKERGRERTPPSARGAEREGTTPSSARRV